MSSTTTLHVSDYAIHGAAAKHLAWFSVGAAIAFLTPFVFSSLLDP